MRRATVIIVFLVSLVFGAAVSAAAPNDLRFRITAEGSSLARVFALRTSDLPAGFTEMQAQQVSSALRCPGLSIKLDDLTVNGRETRAYAHLTASSTPGLVASVADVFSNASQAAALFARLMRPALIPCVERELGVTLGSSSGPTVLGHSFGAIPGLRVASDQLSITFRAMPNGKPATVVVALAATHRGRAFALVITGAVAGSGVPAAGALLARMAERIPAGA